MEIKELAVGKAVIKNNVFLAPMAGYTDYAFRSAVLPLGYGLCFTELVSAKGLFYGGNGSAELLRTDSYPLTAAQIFGADPYYMRTACEGEDLKPFEIIDINMGCPVPKVFKNGEGSALLSDINLAEKIIKECVKSGKTITVKIRKGLIGSDDVAKDYALMAENAGASLITIHGRSREDYYSGEPDYESIAKAKAAVSIPVIANGGIFTVEDADKMINKTGADGVMLARGAIQNPFLVCELLGINPQIQLKRLMLTHLDLMLKIYPDKKCAMEFRKFVPYYFKGRENAKAVKQAIYSAQSVEEIKEILNDF